jgi:Helicase conserved C-terminal domain
LSQRARSDLTLDPTWAIASRVVQKAAVVQGDRSVLLEVEHPGYEAARAVLARIAEIEKSPEHVHTYRLSDLALFNAAASGVRAEEAIEGLRSISRFEVPSVVEHEIRDRIARYGTCALHDHPSDPQLLRLSVREPFIRERLARERKLAGMLQPCPDGFLTAIENRGSAAGTNADPPTSRRRDRSEVSSLAAHTKSEDDDR